MVTDPISDMIIRIKNAGYAGKKTVSFPYSKIKYEIAKLLERINYFADVQKKGRKNIKLIEGSIIYNEEGEPAISEIRRISKPGKRVYRKLAEIHKIRNGYGVAVYSTVKGILSDKEARQQKVGGEVLFEFW
ncbi:MAG: 30S ribosomal protein S8 [Patescibacteria group bacterium]